MIINSAEYDGGKLILSVPSLKEVSLFLSIFKPGDYEIKKRKQKRSLDANAYAWALIGKIADAVDDSPEEVYKRYIRDVGSVMTVSCVLVEDVESEVKTFVEGHIGRFVQVGESKLPGCATIKKHYGSSSYDSKQMAHFIDAIVQDCRELSIETRSKEEIESLLEEWK